MECIAFPAVTEKEYWQIKRGLAPIPDYARKTSCRPLSGPCLIYPDGRCGGKLTGARFWTGTGKHPGTKEEMIMPSSDDVAEWMKHLIERHPEILQIRVIGSRGVDGGANMRVDSDWDILISVTSTSAEKRLSLEDHPHWLDLWFLRQNGVIARYKRHFTHGIDFGKIVKLPPELVPRSDWRPLIESVSLVPLVFDRDRDREFVERR